LRGRIALVSGAGGPMGRAIAERLASEGVNLVLCDISGKRLDATAQALHGVGVAAHRADVMQRDEAQAVVDLGLRTFGHIDILVNVVGGIKAQSLYTPFLELSEAQWDATFALNLKPALHFVQAVAPGMLQRQWGRIVNIGSVVFAGEGGQADYAAAKAAVLSLTRSLAEELAPHVNVNCIAPGLIGTTAVERLTERERAHFVERSLLGRVGQPDEIGAAVAFLASDDAAFLTGEVIAVSGGNHPHL
jgi:3-oxoacyl-[acyl-carrier protein] reductase